MTDLVQTRDTVLTRCVACSPQEFIEDYWGRAPLLARAEDLGGDFADLFSAAAVDELVSERGLRTPFLRMAKDGNVASAASYTRGGGAGAGITDQAADDKILKAIDGGSTLVLQGLHRTWPPLVRFGARLAEELGHPVQINAYITPPENQGFAPHHDVHDVFVLQIAGHKHWTVHAPVVEHPLDNQPFDGYKPQIAERVAEPPLIDITLGPGDALYLPRGTVHSAQARGDTSIHLTVGIHPLTRYNLVRFLLDAVQDDPALRESLPAGVDLGDPEVLSPHLQDVIAALTASLQDRPVEPIARQVAANLDGRTRPEPIGPLAQLAASEALTSESPIRRRQALRFRLTHSTDRESLSIGLLDRTLTLPADTEDAVRLALDGRTFTPAELPGLEAEEQLTLARRLLREGVLVPA